VKDRARQVRRATDKYEIEAQSKGLTRAEKVEQLKAEKARRERYQRYEDVTDAPELLAQPYADEPDPEFVAQLQAKWDRFMEEANLCRTCGKRDCSPQNHAGWHPDD
jgi:hypothetical protein